MLTEPKSWKDRLYDSYVSSGQVNTASTDAGSFFAGRAAYLEKAIRRHFPSDRQARIIDLGCGHGTFLYFLKRAGYSNIVGVDVSAEQIQQARALGIPEAVEGQLDDFLVRTASGSVDAVIAFDIFEHLDPEQLFATLDEIYRVLKLGGRVILHVPNAEGIYGMRIRYGDFTHEQAFTANSLRQVTRTAGFTRFEAFEDKPIPHGIFSIARRVIWDCGTLPHRLLLSAETGGGGFILSQNMLAVAYK